jgi:hypothetical protein
MSFALNLDLAGRKQLGEFGRERDGFLDAHNYLYPVGSPFSSFLFENCKINGKDGNVGYVRKFTTNISLRQQ